MTREGIEPLLFERSLVSRFYIFNICVTHPTKEHFM
jgi:hypothetical protein